MCAADRHHYPGADQGPPGLALTFAADTGAVRTALTATMGWCRGLGLSSETVGGVEIVLAEVLNNIVEHAFAGRVDGRIALEIDRQDNALALRIRDDGHPMPGGSAPEGARPNLDCPLPELPEGGFGWFMIRAMTEGLGYRRVDGQNELSFRLPIGPREPRGGSGPGAGAG
ncbi:MAG: ATP-binding protein [Maritimibacter sp.]|nr:ATP-binding protein [Maritimibacter sp.]